MNCKCGRLLRVVMIMGNLYLYCGHCNETYNFVEPEGEEGKDYFVIDSVTS